MDVKSRKQYQTIIMPKIALQTLIAGFLPKTRQDCLIDIKYIQFTLDFNHLCISEISFNHFKNNWLLLLFFELCVACHFQVNQTLSPLLIIVSAKISLMMENFEDPFFALIIMIVYHSIYSR